MSLVDSPPQQRFAMVAVPIVLLALTGGAIWVASGGVTTFQPAEIRLGTLGSTLLVLLFFAVVTERVVEVVLNVMYGAERLRLMEPLAEELSHNAAMADMMRRDLEMLSRPQERVALFTEELAGEAAMARSATAAVVAQVSRALSKLRQKKLRRAVAIGFLIGIAISAAGFQILAGVVATIPNLTSLSEGQTVYMAALDILLTAAAIAGGAEIVHRLLTSVLLLREKTPDELVHESCQIGS